MECFTNTKGFWQISSPFMDQVTLFRRNLYHALQASTEYTWIYFDAAAKWYPITLEKYYEDKLAQNGGGKARLWRELLPGIDNAILAARNPLAYAKAQLQAGQAKLICKEDFESGQLNMTTWSSKQAGTIEVDNTQGASSKASASLKGVKSGSIYFSIPVTPGEMYLLRAKAKSLRPENKLTLCGKSDPVWAVEAGFSNPDPQGWMQAETTLFVPDKVKELSMHCGVQSKVEPWSDCRFDDVELYLIK